MGTQAIADPEAAGADALKRHAWREAFDILAAAGASDALSAHGLELLGEAAWWSGEPEKAIDARERSHARYLDEANPQRAGFLALTLARSEFARGAEAVAGAWMARAERHLEAHKESPEYALLAVARATVAVWRGDLAGALDNAQAALELATRVGSQDAQALALNLIGRIRIESGDVTRGLADLDEATVAAVSGEVSLQVTGAVYCSTIDSCRDLADYRRALQWTDAAERWCERQSITGFPGVCRVRRAEIMALRGAWPQAEREARLACDELARFARFEDVAAGFYEIGEIRLRIGDLAAADDAFRRAHELGHPAEPGLSLLRLAEGQGAAAAAALQRALDDQSRPLARARLLPAQVELALASGDRVAAASAAAELEAIATQYGSDALHAAAACARGAVELAAGEIGPARTSLREALRRWQEIDAPYEAARTRVLLGRAHRAEDDEASAAMEFQAAKAAFERLGARPDADGAAALLGSFDDAPAGTPLARRTFLFTDIVGSTSLVEAIGDEAWQSLIHWHDETLRSLVAAHGGEEIRHAGDGLVVSFADPVHALECAIAIQRALAEHRRSAGFAPAVRIGVHQADVARRGRDYAGKGIHLAARIGALAGAGEILVSAATLASAGGGFRAGGARTEKFKGITEPVDVAPLEWR